MGDKTSLLVTGATGFLGSHLSLGFLQADEAVKVYCPARARGGVTPERRILQSINEAAWVQGMLEAEGLTLSKRVQPIACDYTRLAEDASARKALPPMAEIWHCASAVQFESDSARDLQQSNVDGLVKALELRRLLGVSVFNYVSTAYTSGRLEGEIAECLHPFDQPYNNPYEETKNRAEHLVAEAARAEGFYYRILRPSVIVGDSRTGRTNSNVGLYIVAASVFRGWEMVRKVDPEYMRREGILRVSIGVDDEVNFIPVNHVVEGMLAEWRRGQASLDRVTHLTNDRLAKTSDLIAAFSETIGLELRGVGRAPLMTKAEKALERLLSPYQPYLSIKRQFLRRDEDIVALGQPRLRRLLECCKITARAK